MKHIGIFISYLIGTSLIAACSSSGSSSDSAPNEALQNSSCEAVIAAALPQSGDSPIRLASVIVASANENQLSLDLATRCLDEKLQVQCSNEICLLHERIKQ